MTVRLSKEALGSLPAPDSEGLVRVTATIKVTKDGECDLLELNDSPVGKADDDEAPMPSQDLPDLDAAEGDIYKP